MIINFDIKFYEACLENSERKLRGCFVREEEMYIQEIKDMKDIIDSLIKAKDNMLRREKVLSDFN